MTAIDFGAAVVELDDEADLARGRAAAERVLAAAPDLPEMALLQLAERTKTDATLVVAAVDELAERLWAGALNADSRDDLAIDLLELAARIQGFALAVRA